VHLYAGGLSSFIERYRHWGDYFVGNQSFL
jgi:hypothetical protein